MGMQHKPWQAQKKETTTGMSPSAPAFLALRLTGKPYIPPYQPVRPDCQSSVLSPAAAGETATTSIPPHSIPTLQLNCKPSCYSPATDTCYSRVLHTSTLNHDTVAGLWVALLQHAPPTCLAHSQDWYAAVWNTSTPPPCGTCPHLPHLVFPNLPRYFLPDRPRCPTT
eukprot:366055-Chlamydomonas_euryale.AAC.7